jgi:hypothetical protein
MNYLLSPVVKYRTLLVVWILCPDNDLFIGAGALERRGRAIPIATSMLGITAPSAPVNG